MIWFVQLTQVGGLGSATMGGVGSADLGAIGSANYKFLAKKWRSHYLWSRAPHQVKIVMPFQFF